MEIIRKYNQCTNPHGDGEDLFYINMYYDGNFNINYYYNTWNTIILFNKPKNEFVFDKNNLFFITEDKNKLNNELETLMVKTFLKEHKNKIEITKNKLEKLEKDKKLLLSLLNKYFRDEKIKKITE